MNSFPTSIILSMRQSGAMTTCVPVQFDNEKWESTVFFELGGKQCKDDRRILRKTQSSLPVSIEADLIEHANASVVMLRFEVMTSEEMPLVGEVLLAPGMGDVQFETLRHLTEQSHLKMYFGDSAYYVLYSQQIILGDRERREYDEILQDAVAHDALVRLSGKYDAMKALHEVVDHYEIK
ncbi:MAG: hypothetical protein GKR96_06960 [Gammaproteobacteria bacterium]|nr:hypothetical protein [Gammaproteobacteria bacterium]